MFVSKLVIFRPQIGIRREGFHVPDAVEHEFVHAPACFDRAVLQPCADLLLGLINESPM